MKSWNMSLVFAIVFLAAALVFDVAVGQYVNSLSYGPPLSDIVLDNIPVIDLRMLEVFGFEIIMAAYFLYAIFYAKRSFPYVLKQTALLILIRNISIVLTHLPSPDGTLNHDIVPVFTFLTFEHDLIFSGHVAFPFLAFLMYKARKAKMFFLGASMAMGVIVLLTHSHYSVDVWAAFFFTYTSFKLGEFLFKPKPPREGGEKEGVVHTPQMPV